VLVWAESEMLDGLTRVLRSSEENSVGTGWGSHGELVESESLTAGSDDASTGGGGETEGSDGKLWWSGQETVVVGDGANDDKGLSYGLGLLVADELVDSGKGDWWAVDLGHEKAAEDDFVEARVGSASQESVKLDQEGKIGIVALGGPSVARPLVVFL